MPDFDYPAKNTIRKVWCKPLIEHIYRKLKCKFVYLGLPGIKALDVIEWKDYIEKIIAFDCGDYSKTPNKKLALKNIKELNEILSKLERENSINYSLYRGYLEKIVLRGYDDDLKNFRENSFVTIYNLDFCNSLNQPITVTDLKGNSFQYYKTETIRKLLELQKDFKIDSPKKKFIMFITINQSILEEESQLEKEYYDSYLIKKYIKRISRLPSKTKNIRLLRLYAFGLLRDHFKTCQFIPDFLPPISYTGIGGNKMMCLTIIGTHKRTNSSIAPLNQKFDQLLNSKFLSVSNKKIVQWKESGIDEIDTEIDPTKLFDSINTVGLEWK